MSRRTAITHHIPSNETASWLILLLFLFPEELLLLALPLFELTELGLAERPQLPVLLLALCAVFGEFLVMAARDKTTVSVRNAGSWRERERT